MGHLSVETMDMITMLAATTVMGRGEVMVVVVGHQDIMVAMMMDGMTMVHGMTMVVVAMGTTGTGVTIRTIATTATTKVRVKVAAEARVVSTGLEREAKVVREEKKDMVKVVREEKKDMVKVAKLGKAKAREKETFLVNSVKAVETMHACSSMTTKSAIQRLCKKTMRSSK
jgi:hypothetical protein